MAGAEVYLNPGGWHFHQPGRAEPPVTHIRTLLGSCVSVILWHPQQRLAGMSHVVLPGRSRRPGEALDARYCDEAVAMFALEVNRAGALPRQFQALVIGGGRMLSTEKISIGERNIEAARRCLKLHGFIIHREHVGKDGYRKVEIDLRLGQVTVFFANQRIPLLDTGPAASLSPLI